VALKPSGNGFTLEMNDANRPPFGGSSWVEYQVEVPSGVQVVAHATSGQLDVDGVRGAVKADTTSGQLHVSNIDGSVDARAGSGNIQLENITGPVKVQANSGAIRATGVQHLTDAQASSGAISVDGVFAEAAKVKTTSGSVQLTIAPNSAVNVDIKTDSGAIQTHNVADTSQASRGRLTGRVGTPSSDAVLSIETSSGAVSLN
jgi:DUF4097 and DUF4098 domain-containing protein YvlB